MIPKIYFFATFLEAAKTIEKLQAIPICENIYPNNLKNREFSDAEAPRFDFKKSSPLFDIGADFSESKMGASASEKTDSSGCLGIWSFNKGRVVITGMGRDSVLDCVERKNFLQMLASPELVNAVWVNIGIAGASCGAFSFGQYVCVHSTSFLQNHIEESFVLREGSGTHLYTSLVPVHATPENIKKESLIDMEGYFLAVAAKKHGAQLHMGKVVSDHCSSESSNLIKQRIEELSQILASAVDPGHPSGWLPCH